MTEPYPSEIRVNNGFLKGSPKHNTQEVLQPPCPAGIPVDRPGHRETDGEDQQQGLAKLKVEDAQPEIATGELKMNIV